MKEEFKDAQGAQRKSKKERQKCQARFPRVERN